MQTCVTSAGYGIVSTRWLSKTNSARAIGFNSVIFPRSSTFGSLNEVEFQGTRRFEAGAALDSARRAKDGLRALMNRLDAPSTTNAELC